MKKIILIILLALPLSIFSQNIQKDSTETKVFRKDSSVVVQSIQTLEITMSSQFLEAEIAKMQQEKIELEKKQRAINDRINQFLMLLGQVKQVEAELKKPVKK